MISVKRKQICIQKEKNHSSGFTMFRKLFTLLSLLSSLQCSCLYSTTIYFYSWLLQAKCIKKLFTLNQENKTTKNTYIRQYKQYTTMTLSKRRLITKCKKNINTTQSKLFTNFSLKQLSRQHNIHFQEIQNSLTSKNSAISN